MPDFTIKTYIKLLEALKSQGYEFQTFEEFLTKPRDKTIILRHDVDKNPQNSLRMAEIENQHQIKGTYNFRAHKHSWNEEIIKEIAKLDHEIGYHYEDLAIHKGNHETAIESFVINLKKIRKIAQVSTICMHGSPTSKHDSRKLWENYNYKDHQIIGEPYFDIDFEQTLYFTDTGRRWDGDRVSIRDRVSNTQRQLVEKKTHRIRKTKHIIKAANEKALPDQIMFTIHPQRWHSSSLKWTKEFILQNLKNVAKAALRQTGRNN